MDPPLGSISVLISLLVSTVHCMATNTRLTELAENSGDGHGADDDDDDDDEKEEEKRTG